MMQGSIDLDKLKELLKAKHPALYKSQSGKSYLNITVWVNDSPDQFGNRGSLQVYDRHSKEKGYIGNFGLFEEQDAARNGTQPNQQNNQSSNQEDDDLPF